MQVTSSAREAKLRRQELLGRNTMAVKGKAYQISSDPSVSRIRACVRVRIRIAVQPFRTAPSAFARLLHQRGDSCPGSEDRRRNQNHQRHLTCLPIHVNVRSPSRLHLVSCQTQLPDNSPVIRQPRLRAYRLHSRPARQPPNHRQDSNTGEKPAHQLPGHRQNNDTIKKHANNTLTDAQVEL